MRDETTWMVATIDGKEVHFDTRLEAWRYVQKALNRGLCPDVYRVAAYSGLMSPAWSWRDAEPVHYRTAA